MKKQRMLAGLLVLMMLLTMVSVPAFAEDSLTAESILKEDMGWESYIVSQSADFLSTTYADAESLKPYTYGNWATPEDVVEGKGLKLDGSNDHFYWKFGKNQLNSNQAVQVRVYMPNGGIPSGIRIDAPGAGWWTRSASAATETAHAIRIYGNGWDTTVASSRGEWQTYLFTTDYVVGGENTDKKFKIYKKADGDTEWTTLTAGTSLVPQNGWADGIYIGGTDSFPAYVAAVEILSQELLWEPDGNEYTLEQIVGGQTVTVNENMIFDENIDAAKVDAVTVNHNSGGVDPDDFVVGEDGLEITKQDPNAWFAWGWQEGWNPKPESPVQFRMKLGEGTSANLEVGTPEARILIQEDKMVFTGASGVFASKALVAGNDWVTYLLATEDTDGNGTPCELTDQYALYAKKDGDAAYTLMAKLNFSQGGWNGFHLEATAPKNAGNAITPKVYLDYLTIYRLREYKPIVTDPQLISMESNPIVLDEDFTDGAEGWEINGDFQCVDGVVQLNAGENPASSSLYYKTTNLDLSGDWYLNFKLATSHKITGVFSLGGAGNKRVLFVINSGSFTTNKGGNTSAPWMSWNTLYEWLFAFKNYDTFTVYRRLANTNAEWTVIAENISMEDKFDDHFTLGMSEPNAKVVLDDVRIYQGTYAKVGMPVVEAGKVKTTGLINYGTPKTEDVRRMSMITAVYDKKYGYTKSIEGVEHIVYGGEPLDLSHEYSVAGISAETDEAAVMLWDTVENGIPVAESAETVDRNMATATPADDEKIGVTYTSEYNEVKIKGYLGRPGVRLTASLVDSGGTLAAALQTKANDDGMIDTLLGINPQTCADGIYKLRIRYQDQFLEKEVMLYANGIQYGSVIDGDSMNAFLNNYANDQVKAWTADKGFGTAVYNRMLENLDGATPLNIYEFRQALDPAVEAEIQERVMLKEINSAVAAKKWADLEVLITQTYAKLLGVGSNPLTGISNPKTLFLRMVGGYQTPGAILADFEKAVEEQKKVEGNNGGGSLGGGGFGGGGSGGALGGGSGGGFVGGTVAADTEIFPELETKPVQEIPEFKDLASVAWAEKSIRALQINKIISGDGDGNFYPDRPVSREEFLKMAMQAAGISNVGNAELSFADVDSNEWYYGYVAAAYQNGIVKGMDNTRFGIGETIVRADMAVMLRRILEHCGISVQPIKPAFIFDDYASIPDYAADSIALLCEGGLMQGVGNNSFMAGASATRAEAAVAIQRIYDYIAERR